MVTLVFDDQESHSFFKCGDSNHRIKACNVVTLFDCSNHISKVYEVTDKKNYKTKPFIKIADSTYIKDTVVMSGALNTSAEVTDLITQRKGISI